jgi:hypothetical protein
VRGTGFAILAIVSPLPASASTGFESQQGTMQWVYGIERAERVAFYGHVHDVQAYSLKQYDSTLIGQSLGCLCAPQVILVIMQLPQDGLSIRDAAIT